MIYFRDIWDDDLRKLAIQIVKVLAKFDSRDMVKGVIDIARTDEEILEEIKNKTK